MIGALLLTFVLIFAFQAENLTSRWVAVLLIAVPIMIQVYFNSSLTYMNVTDKMTNWAALADSTNTATNGVWYYTVTNAGAPANVLNRFFRAGAVKPCP